MSWLLVLGMSVMLAPSISADPPKREDGKNAERERPERERSERDRSERERPERDRSERGGHGAFEPGRMMKMLPIFAAIDSDRDGEISGEEIDNASVGLRKLDKNNDGKLDRQELRPDFAGRPGPPPRDGDRGPRDRGPRDRGPRDRGPRDRAPLERLMQLDKNSDGELSAEELTGLPERGKRVLAWGDRDKDGTLSPEELKKMNERGENTQRRRGDSDGKERGRDKGDRD